MYLTEEERKKPLRHEFDHFEFRSCVDLSQGVEIIPLWGHQPEWHGGIFARDAVTFMAYWMNSVWPRLNGFSGMDTIRWDVVTE